MTYQRTQEFERNKKFYCQVCGKLGKKGQRCCGKETVNKMYRIRFWTINYKGWDTGLMTYDEVMPALERRRSQVIKPKMKKYFLYEFISFDGKKYYNNGQL